MRGACSFFSIGGLAAWFCCSPLPLHAGAAVAASPVPEKLKDGVLVAVSDGFLKLEVCGDNIIRVAFSQDREFFARRTLATEARRSEPARWKLTKGKGFATLSTRQLQVRVD